MPTLTDLTGFEFGLGSVLGGGLLQQNQGAAVTFPAGRTGSFCCQCAAASGGTSTAERNVSGDRLVQSFYIRITVAPSVVRPVWFCAVSAGGRPEIRYQTSNNHLEFGFVGGTYQDLGAVTTNTWYRIDLDVNLNPNPRTMDCQLDGSAGTQATLATTGSTFVRWALGTDGAGASTITTQFDDVVCSQTAADYPLGEYEVDWLGIASDGTHSFTDNDFSTGDAGTQRAQSYTDFHLMVDEAPAWTITRSTTDNITQRVIRTTGYVALAPGTARTGETAGGVKAYVGYSSPSGTGTNLAGAEVLNSASAVTVLWGDIGGTLQNYDVQSNNFKAEMVTKPAGNWTKTEIEAIRFRVGGSSDITPVPTWQMLGLEVAYPVAGAQQFSLTAATSTETAQALSVTKPIRKTLSPALSTETAQQLTLFVPGIDLSPALETDAAQALNIDKRVTLVPKTETDAAQALNVDKRVTITPALSTETVAAAVPLRPITPATSTEVAVALDFFLAKTIIPATSTETAQALSYVKPIHKTLTAALENDLATVLSFSGPTQVNLTPATETELAVALTFTKTIYKSLTSVTETDAAQALSLFIIGQMIAGAVSVSDVSDGGVTISNGTGAEVAVQDAVGASVTFSDVEP